MLINLLTKKKGSQCNPGGLAGRVGHQVVRINDSIFVIGGTDQQGKFINVVHRINCQNNRVDTIILEKNVSIEGFSLFCWEETLFLWGGRTLGQYSNQLLQFDGNNFIHLHQTGTIPYPRAYHTSVTFGSKYLILFGGNATSTFFRDWNLLNLKTFEWKSLVPNIQLFYSMNSSMVWLNGRGVLLLNNTYDPDKRTVIPNLFYTFYVTDFNHGFLNIEPLLIEGHSAFQQFVFSNISMVDNNALLIFGGYKVTSDKQFHGHSFVLQLQTCKSERVKFHHRQKFGFQSIFYKNKLFMIGGILKNLQMEDTLQVHQFSFQKMHFKRHVCAACHLYFDEEWIKSSREVYPLSRIKQDHDYNHFHKMDNRVLARFSAYIPQQLLALTLIINALKSMSASNILLSFKTLNEKFSNHISEMVDQTYHYLKVACILRQQQPQQIVNYFLNYKLLSRDSQTKLINRQISKPIEQSIIELKLGALRIGRAALITIKISEQQNCIIYISCNQLQNPQTNYLSSSNFHYTYNTQTKEVSSSIMRHVIYENVKYAIKDIEYYQQVRESSLTMIIFCGQQLQSQLNFPEQNIEIDTAQSCMNVFYTKDQNRKTIPMIQLSFLQSTEMTQIYIDHNRVHFINLRQVLKSDSKSQIISPINYYEEPLEKINQIQKIQLYHYPSQYWYKKILIYHKGRMIKELQNNTSVCGVIILNDSVKMDLTETNLSSEIVEMHLDIILHQLQGLKRNIQN